MQASSVSTIISGVSTQSNNMLIQARSRQVEQDQQSQQAQSSSQAERSERLEQTQRMHTVEETDRAEQTRDGIEQAQPTVNAEGQAVGTRINTIA